MESKVTESDLPLLAWKLLKTNVGERRKKMKRINFDIICIKITQESMLSLIFRCTCIIKNRKGMEGYSPISTGEYHRHENHRMEYHRMEKHKHGASNVLVVFDSLNLRCGTDRLSHGTWASVTVTASSVALLSLPLG